MHFPGQTLRAGEREEIPEKHRYEMRVTVAEGVRVSWLKPPQSLLCPAQNQSTNQYYYQGEGWTRHSGCKASFMQDGIHPYSPWISWGGGTEV